MINRATDVNSAVALLERADPVDEEQLAAELDLVVARERVTRLIAAEAQGSDRAPAHLGPTRRHLATRSRLTPMVSALVAAAAVAVGAVALDGGTPAVQSASAKTISRALRALAAPTGSILHIDAATIEITRGHTYSWDQEVYEQTVPPYQARVIDKRLPGTPPGTEGVYGIGIGEQIYDPIRNIIYDPASPKPRPSPGAHSLTPAQEARLYQPYMAQYIAHLRAMLASGKARIAGRAVVAGRDAIKITSTAGDEIDYVAADGSYVPIKTVQGTPSSPAGQVINVYRTFEYLRAAGNSGLLDLKTQHPSARVDRSLSDFRRAINHQYPDG